MTQIQLTFPKFCEKSFILFQDQKFDIGHVTKYFESKRNTGDLAIYYELDQFEDVQTRGILEICPFSNRVTRFLEKPSVGQTESRNASVVFYFLRYDDALQQLIKEYVSMCDFYSFFSP